MHDVKALAALCVAAGMLAGCKDRAVDRPVIPATTAGAAATEGPASAPAAAAVDIAQIVANPAAYAGKVVTVSSRVDEVFTPWAFKLEGNDFLVIGATPAQTFNLDPNGAKTAVRITGTVRILQAADFQREYGRGVDDLLFRRFEGKPALIAQSVQKAG